MEKKLVELHYEWMEKGVMSGYKWAGGGLCEHLAKKYSYELDLFEPVDKEIRQLAKEGLCTCFWASGLEEDTKYRILATEYTLLRQTIVLLICAMCGEL